MKAFPVKSSTFKNPNDSVEYHEYSAFGMELRDYFAAKAMQGELSASDSQPKPEHLAKYSYEVADAMMEARGE